MYISILMLMLMYYIHMLYMIHTFINLIRLILNKIINIFNVCMYNVHIYSDIFGFDLIYAESNIMHLIN